MPALEQFPRQLGANFGNAHLARQLIKKPADDPFGSIDVKVARQPLGMAALGRGVDGVGDHMATS